MRNRFYLTLTTWPFLCALATLLGNDWWLKFHHPGVLSGKLSDFAGLVLVGLVVTALLPQHARKISLGLAVAFIWWKSSLSQSFIDFVNAYAPLNIGRTIDYGDLVALVVLPACRYVVQDPQRFSIPWSSAQKLLFVPVVLATAFGTIATSIIPTRQDYEIRRTSSGDELQRERVHETVASVAARHGLSCENCPRPDGSMVYSGTSITMRYAFTSADTVTFAIEALPSGLFFGASGRDKADALQSDLKLALGHRFRGLEFVQRLGRSH